MLHHEQARQQGFKWVKIEYINVPLPQSSLFGEYSEQWTLNSAWEILHIFPLLLVTVYINRLFLIVKSIKIGCSDIYLQTCLCVIYVNTVYGLTKPCKHVTDQYLLCMSIGIINILTSADTLVSWENWQDCKNCRLATIWSRRYLQTCSLQFYKGLCNHANHNVHNLPHLQKFVFLTV